MIEPLPQLQLLEAFFSSLNDSQISYAILRNATEVETGDAHDVDMTIDSACLIHAETILHETAQKLGWKKHLQTGQAKDSFSIKCYHYYFIDETSQQIFIVHIDIFPTFTWKGYILIDNQSLLKNSNSKSFYRSVSKPTESVCNLFVRLLFNGYIKDKYKLGIQQVFKETPAEVKTLMSKFLPDTLASQILQFAQQGKWTNIEEIRPEIIRGIKRTATRKRLSYVRYLINKAIHRKGAIIAFIGTDGSGKSTIINGIPQIIGNTFSGDTIDYYHWRPGIIKPEKKLTPEGNVISNVQPHTSKPYGKLLSLIKMGVYILDYSLGYWLNVRWKAAKGHLVVFDRYYYDFYIDQIRYRLNLDNKLIRFFQFFIPSPDTTFVLLGDAQEIYERKKELPPDEIERQLRTLKNYQDKFSNPVEINVSASIPNVLYNVSKNILITQAKRNN